MTVSLKTSTSYSWFTARKSTSKMQKMHIKWEIRTNASGIFIASVFFGHFFPRYRISHFSEYVYWSSRRRRNGRKRLHMQFLKAEKTYERLEHCGIFLLTFDFMRKYSANSLILVTLQLLEVESLKKTLPKLSEFGKMTLPWLSSQAVTWRKSATKLGMSHLKKTSLPLITWAWFTYVSCSWVTTGGSERIISHLNLWNAVWNNKQQSYWKPLKLRRSNHFMYRSNIQ